MVGPPCDRRVDGSAFLRSHRGKGGYLLLDFLAAAVWALDTAFFEFRNRQDAREFFVATLAEEDVVGHWVTPGWRVVYTELACLGGNARRPR